MESVSLTVVLSKRFFLLKIFISFVLPEIEQK